MTMVLELNTDLEAIASALGSDVKLANKLLAAGVTVDAKPKSLVLLYGGGVVATAGLSLGPLKTILSGKGSLTAKAIMKGPFDAAMLKASNAIVSFEPGPGPGPVLKEVVTPESKLASVMLSAHAVYSDALKQSPDAGMAKVKAIKYVKNSMEWDLKTAKDQVEDWIVNGWTFTPDVVTESPIYDDVSAPWVFDAVLSAYVTDGKIAGIKVLRKMTGIGLKEAKDQVEGWAAASGWIDPYPYPHPKKKTLEEVLNEKVEIPKIKPKKVEGIMNTAVVPLAQATQLYQPVKGSGSSSKYFAIAIGNELKVGVRIKSDLNISVRAEGAVEKFKSNLQDAGFDSQSGGHWSFHLKVENAKMMRKVIGSTLAALNYRFNDYTVNVDKLVGAGA